MTSAAPPFPDGRYPVAASAPTPLGIVLVFTAVNSLSAGLVTSGLFFAARAAYGFGPTGNYGLGVLIGTTYTIGALSTARVVASAGGRARAVALRILTLLALATLWPLLLPGRPLAVWLVAATYGPTIAALWPITQTYLTGGRAGESLRSAVGSFNLTWGAALVVGFGAVGPLLETAPEITLPLLGMLHLASAGLLAGFAPVPIACGVDESSASGDEWRLRRVFQGLLPLTNVLAFALAPFLPDAFARLGLPAASRASFAVAWLLPRAIAFGVLGRWHGWHGRFGTAIVGAGFLVGGFVIALLAPRLGPGAAGIGLEILGLASFGIGMATVYTAAFYYAQAVGRAALGAGGRHEALLGVGASVGPLLGLLTSLAVELGLLAAGAFEPVLVGGCLTVAVVLTARALRR